MRKWFLSCALFLCTADIFAQISGTRTIGTSTSDYASSIVDALVRVQNDGGVNGPLVLEIQNSYNYSVHETNFSISITAITGASAVNTITIRPATGVSKTIGSVSSDALLFFNGCSHIIVDGRSGGVGTSRNLSLVNGVTSTSATVLFLNNATNNTVTYCNITFNGGLTSSTTAVVQFGGSSSSGTGNSGNTVSNNDIDASLSGCAIMSTGLSGSENKDNIIQNNLIHDFYISNTSAIGTYGVRLVSNNSNWTIDGNKFYQTSARDYGSNFTYSVISVEGAANLNYHTITNNVIGGSAANGTGTYQMGLANTTSTHKLFVIQINGSTVTPTLVQGNTINNLTLNSAFASAGSSLFIGLHIAAGIVNTGTGNTIGSSSTTGTVNINSTATTGGGALVVGINGASSSAMTITNNAIGSITTSAASDAVFFNVYPISIGGTGSPINVNSNTIGSSSVANSINITNGNTASLFSVRGINFGSGATGAEINVQNNVISNVSFTAASNLGVTVAGIYANPSNSTTIYSITGNTIANISTTGNRNSSTTVQTTLCGIIITNTAGTAPTTTQTVSNNTVHSLINTSTTTGLSNSPYVSGIIFTNGSATTTKSICSRNTIHSLQISSSGSAAPLVNGIYTNNVALDILNNIIRLGVDKDGNSLTSSNQEYRGIFKNTSNAVSAINNTVVIAGSGVGNTATNTAAYFRANSNVSDIIQNNIFINRRSNTAAGGKHYAIRLNNATANTINYNVYFADGSGGVLGTANAGTTDRTTIANWRTAVTADLYSTDFLPQLTGANVGDAVGADFLKPSSGNNLFGLASTSVATDIAGTARATSGLNTAGAYELAQVGVWSATAASSDWNTAANWTSNSVPGSGASIFIPATTTNAPAITSNTLVGRLLDLNTADLNIGSGITLTATGELRNTGNISATNGGITLSGLRAQTLSGKINVGTLTINNAAGVSISGDSTIINSTLVATAGTLTTGGLLRISPTGAITGNYANISGSVTLQQNVIGQRGWRVFSNPFTTTQTISNLASTNGINISTTASGASGLTDVRTYTNGTGWNNVTATTLAANTPYALFIRGLSGEVTGLNYTGGPTAFTYNASGTLNGNTVTVTPSATGFTLVGNPFAAPVNSSALTNGTGKSYFVYQIARNGDGRTRAGGWSAQLSSSATTPIPTLGVIAYEAGSAGSYNISNTDINTTNAATSGLFRTQQSGQAQQPAATIENLALVVEQNGVLQDNLFIRQDEASTSGTNDTKDLLKLTNDNVNFYTLAKATNQRLAVDARDVRKDSSRIPLGISAAQGGYTLRVTNNNIEKVTATLFDSYLQTRTELTQNTTYHFTITADSNSRGNNRFEVQFNNKLSTIIPAITNNGFTAKVLGNSNVNNTLSIQVENAQKQVTITVMDVQGRVLATKQGANGVNRVQVNLRNGIHLVQVTDGNSVVTEKIMN